MSLRGSCRKHGRQNPPDALLSGWQRDSDNPTQVQQEQEFRLTRGYGILGVASLAWVA
jgi:hypothetical protein